MVHIQCLGEITIYDSISQLWIASDCKTVTLPHYHRWAGHMMTMWRLKVYKACTLTKLWNPDWETQCRHSSPSQCHISCCCSVRNTTGPMFQSGWSQEQEVTLLSVTPHLCAKRIWFKRYTETIMKYLHIDKFITCYTHVNNLYHVPSPTIMMST